MWPKSTRVRLNGLCVTTAVEAGLDRFMGIKNEPIGTKLGVGNVCVHELRTKMATIVLGTTKNRRSLGSALDVKLSIAISVHRISGFGVIGVIEDLTDAVCVHESP